MWDLTVAKVAKLGLVGTILLLLVLKFFPPLFENSVGSMFASADETIKQTSTQLESNPKDVDNLVKRGYAYYTAAEYQRAIDDYTKAFEIRPSADILRKRAEVYDMMQKYDLAKKDREDAHKVK
jgi:tetratricopeptide (TPR) repeat protein